MKQVTKAEFYRIVKDDRLDIHPCIEGGKYPWTHTWKFIRRAGEPVFGKSIPTEVVEGMVVYNYFIDEKYLPKNFRSEL